MAKIQEIKGRSVSLCAYFVYLCVTAFKLLTQAFCQL